MRGLYLLPAQDESERVPPDLPAPSEKVLTLPRWAIVALQPFYSFPLEKVRIHVGIPEFIRARAATDRPIAVSCRYNIYIDPRYASFRHPTAWRIILHELRHIEQYHRYGEKLYEDYRRFKKTHGYWNNPFEIDAYAFERRVAEALAL